MPTAVRNPFAWTPPHEGECFMCGATPPPELTREHVFPRWLQERFLLWDQEMNLLNRTRIPYRQLTVPACVECNTGVLSQLDDYVQRHVDAGFDTFCTIDRDQLALWLCKVYFGLLWRELSLAMDRSDPMAGTIVDSELLEEFKIIRGLLRGLIEPRLFASEMRPWSIFVVRAQTIDDYRHDFDYQDGLARVIAMRMGDVGVIACLEDNGLQQRMYGHAYEALAPHSLHPMQFQELYAHVGYNQMRLERQTTFLSAVPDDPEGPTLIMPLPPEIGFSNAPVTRDLDAREYAHVLALAWRRWEIPEEDLFVPPDKFVSILRDDAGNFIEIPPGSRVILPTQAQRASQV